MTGNEAPWDYIIVGGGSAGCVLANRLSADPALRVLLLEAGGENRSLAVRIPAGIGAVIFKDRFNWKYPAAPDPTRDGMVDSWSGGRGLGGSSSINGMLFIRGDRADYDHWEATGCSGWRYDDVLPHFRAIEHFEGGGDRYRGDSGPLSVSFPASRPELVDLWMRAAQACGHAFNADYNGAESTGVGLSQASISKGRRHSAAAAFLNPVRHRENLEVRTGCQATRVLFDGDRAAGVEYQHGGARHEVSCKGEVLISSGAIRTPGLLVHSGIGPVATLSELGIAPVRAAEAVGSNLMEHPGVYVKAFTTLPTFNRAGHKHRMPLVLLDWMLRGKGAAAVGTTLAQVLAKSSPAEVAPDLQILLSLVNFSLNAAGDGIVLDSRDGFSMACCLLTPRSRGRVSVVSGDPLAQPLVEHTMFADEEDLDRLALAAQGALELLETDPLKNAITEIDFPLRRDASRDDWHALLRRVSFRGDHPSGTCAMGAGEDAVVDPRLRVRGVRGLRVVDASVIPVIPRANTNAVVMMIADKAATMISNDRNSGVTA